jgi:diguanylate cyclase
MSEKSLEIRRVFQTGHRVFIEGDSGDNAFIIERGRVEIAFERAGRSVRVATLGQGEIFGEMALIDDRPRSATATCLETTEVVVVRREQIRNALVHADPTVRLLLEVLLGRFRSMQGRLDWVNPEPVITREMSAQAAAGPAHRAEALDRLKLQQEIQHAIDTDGFRVLLQPIVSLATGRVDGFEALLRWDHAERGDIPPTYFIQIAEATDLAQAIDRWVCRKVIGIVQTLPHAERHANGPYITINLSGRTIADDAVVDEILHDLEMADISPGRLRLEITEGALIDNPRKAAQVLDAFAHKGIRAAIDDFGTGYSSLAYLVGFPIRMLKIDRAFVDGLKDGGSTLEIVRAIVGMAHGLKIEVVAEGVETMEQLHALWRLQVEYVQGFLTSRPLPPEEAMSLARRGALLSTGPTLLY